MQENVCVSLLSQDEYVKRLEKVTALRRDIARLTDEGLNKLRKWLGEQDGISTDERVSRKASGEDD